MDGSAGAALAAMPLPERDDVAVALERVTVAERPSELAPRRAASRSGEPQLRVSRL